MQGFLDSAGERIAIDSELDWVSELIAEGSGGRLGAQPQPDVGIRVRVEAERRPFETAGWWPLTRGAWHRDGEVVVENACTAGFDVHVACDADAATFTYRWRPPIRDRLARLALPSRFHLLARAVLVQFPALWRAGLRGRAPLHASACTSAGATPLVTAAGGIGRSTLLLRELYVGASATGDNLAAGDGSTLWGLVEPLRVEGANGRRMPHGRREAPLTGYVDSLSPDSVVVLERGPASDPPALVRRDPGSAARALVTSTYMAGELRRFWGFAATLAAGTGAGPGHPPVVEVASSFAERLPCFSLLLERSAGVSLSQLLADLPTEVEA